MGYLIIGLIIVILLFLVAHHFNKVKAKAKLAEIQSAWGQPKDESFHFASIRRYADLTKEKFHRLTDQTINDIDFYRIFTLIDRTTSKVGQQFLFKKVTEPTNLIDYPSQKLIQLVIENKKLREEIQMELLKLNDSDAYYILSALEARLIEEPKWLFLLTVDLIVVISLLVLSFKFPVLLIALLFLTTLNLFIHYWNKNNTFQFTRSIPQLNLLINVSKQLIKKDDLLYDKSVVESISQLKSFQRKSSLISFNNGIGSQGEFGELGKMMNDLIKGFFLIETITFFKVIRELKDKQASIITLFNYVGNIDASISIASLRSGKLKTCQPVFTSSKKEIIAKNIYHPLIKKCTENDLTISNKSVLITGSNMSGKSTFLRTLAINSILAQTIFTCFADEYVSPIVKQFSSIRIDDNLFEGKSYYFQEVNVIGSLIAEVDSTHQNLFILDEVFKGTNTVERIAAAKAILSYLNRGSNIVVVSTHDIELAGMLSSEYELYHFAETIENDKLHFDHKIKPGQVQTRNAIRLLELSNYPSDIINEARQISSTLKTK